MKAIRLTKDDTATIDFIVNNLIANTEDRASPDHLQKLVTDDRSYLFAVYHEQDVIGYALAYKFPSLYSSEYLAYLYDIEVLASYRRKGAGKLLIHTLLADLKADNVKEVFLGTATDNVEGQALFSATGGIRSGEMINDFIYELT